MIARVDKDWNARFDIEKLRLPRWCLTILAVPLLAGSIPWAAFVIYTDFGIQWATLKTRVSGATSTSTASLWPPLLYPPFSSIGTGMEAPPKINQQKND